MANERFFSQSVPHLRLYGMKYFFALAAALAVLHPAFAAPLDAPPGVSSEDFQRAMSQSRNWQIVNHAIYEAVRPSTVQIIAAGGTEVAANADPRMKDPFFRKFFGPPPSQDAPPSIGSGFILDDSGLVVTNLHVVRNAKNVQVILADGTKVQGVIRGSDEWTDIAVIQMKNAKSIRPARLGDSDKVYVGDYVVALGNPFGLQGTFSTGVVSAVARSVPGDPGMKFLQTDAAINPGNSGGPLINLDGEVIGINRMIVSPAGGSVGIGFAIPINEVKKVIADIKANGTVVRPALGVQIENLSPEGKKTLGVETGVVILGVVPGSGADKAGLEQKDVITKVDGTVYDDTEPLRSYILTKRVGDKVTLEIVRNKVVQQLQIVLGKRQ